MRFTSFPSSLSSAHPWAHCISCLSESYHHCPSFLHAPGHPQLSSVASFSSFHSWASVSHLYPGLTHAQGFVYPLTLPTTSQFSHSPAADPARLFQRQLYLQGRGLQLMGGSIRFILPLTGPAGHPCPGQVVCRPKAILSYMPLLTFFFQWFPLLSEGSLHGRAWMGEGRVLWGLRRTQGLWSWE